MEKKKRNTKVTYPYRAVLKLTAEQKKAFHDNKAYLEIRKLLDKMAKRDTKKIDKDI
jgi:hypothetical protein